MVNVFFRLLLSSSQSFKLQLRSTNYPFSSSLSNSLFSVVDIQTGWFSTQEEDVVNIKMFNLEDEFMTAGYRIPWLIWIQLLVLILLILLLYSFTVLALDEFPRTPSDDSNYNVASSSDASFAFGKGTQKGKLPLYDNYGPSSSENCTGFDGHGVPAQYASKVGGGRSIKVEIPNATQRVSAGTNINGRESSATKDASFVSAGMEHHPCYIFRLARKAFLKCLGLDCIAEAPSNREQRKED